MRRLFQLSFLFVFITSPVYAQKQFGFDNRKSSGQPYLKPEESVAKMTVADGFEVKLFAAEPDVVNPIAMTVDEKGRVWVIECFEYPKRTAPGKMPRDRIVILEDTDGDGVCDKRTVFAEGKDFPVPFDMASGLEVGNGGVYVGAPPYLFFIENKNDKPGKFEILLKGFGSQDTHETLNTFQWGPDGWLYGLHGIYTLSEVKPYGDANAPGTKMNAAVWRFHPKTKKFEIFAEGTSNPWGMDWRNTDGQFILACCVIPHLYHMVPGGNYKRQGGQASNPYAYGEIKEICDHTFHKESGWAHAGLISLDTPLMPEKYRNSVIFGSIHGCSLKQNILKPNGSSYTASRGDDFLVSGDKNFRPINLRWGPNGEIYCIDWHDQNPCHQAGADTWDYERGRVFRIQTKGLKTKKAEDLGQKTTAELLDLVNEPAPYRYRTALRLLAEKPIDDRKALVTGIMSKPGKIQLREWWAIFHAAKNIYVFDTKVSDEKWSAVGDVSLDWQIRMPLHARTVDPRAIAELSDAATKVKSPSARRELASVVVRLVENHDVTALLHTLMSRREDAQDPIIPHLLWLAYEKHISKSRGKELDWLRDNSAGNALVTDTIIPRTMRRLIATGKPEDLVACVKFLGDLKDSTAKLRALEGHVAALQNRQLDAPAEWKTVRAALLKETNKDVLKLVNKLSINFRDAEAIKQALAVATDEGKPAQERVEAIRDLALATPQAAVAPLQTLALSNAPDELRVEAIRALASFNHPGLAKELLASWEKYPANLKGEVVNVLIGRKEWARALLDAIETKKVAPTDVSVSAIMRIQGLKDKGLDAQIEKVWGRVRSTPAELSQLIDKTRGQLYEARASFARGKIAFDTHCAKCHKFEGRGSEVGPNIEGAARDIEYLLVNVLDPNRVIGAPYFIRTVTKLNGQNETGLLAAEDDQSITLKTENAILKVIQKKDIEEVRVQEKSLMPEGFGSNIKIQEFRDLIRYTMAHPFITDVEVEASDLLAIEKARPHVGVPGRIVIPDGERDVIIRASVTAPDETKTKLLVGIRNDFKVLVNGQAVNGKGSNTPAQPDQVALDVALMKGENRIEIVFKSKGKDEAVYARFLDPERKLRYPEPDEEKK